MTDSRDGGAEHDLAQVLRAGIVGLNVGRTHVRRYREAARCEVTALCDVDTARLGSYVRADGRSRADPCRT